MKPAVINRVHHLALPDHLADWDALTGWELDRFASMEATLRPTDVLYDVGTEHGALSAVYARWVQSMVLIEPTPDFWRNIRAIWEANALPAPLACWAGLVGRDMFRPEGAADALSTDWPLCSAGGEVGPGGYRYLHEPSHVEALSRITIDALAERVRTPPSALTIDVEGAEAVVLSGARSTLEIHRPLVWVSIHPDLMARDYGASPADVFAIFDDAGYRYDLLGVDHEHHYAAWPAEGRRIERGVVPVW